MLDSPLLPDSRVPLFLSYFSAVFYTASQLGLLYACIFLQNVQLPLRLACYDMDEVFKDGKLFDFNRG